MPGRSLRILCFGDSLTSGFCHFGLDSRPYSIRLKTRLVGALPHRHIEVFTSGVPGDVVANQPWENRLEAELKKRSYDWVVVLGGTNDIGTARSGESTFKALERTYQKITSRGAKLLALTIPECYVKTGWLDKAREEVNENILNLNKTNFHAFDLRSSIPYHSLSDDDRDQYWDDGLHLSPIGYDWMGGHIADALVVLLKEEEASAKAQATSARRRSVEADNSLTFDEEGGNTRHISQGYIVVRKKDLD